jgi:hypothetical protein
MARPKKTATEKRSVAFTIKLTEDERNQLAKAGAVTGMSARIFARVKLMTGRFPQAIMPRVDLDTYLELKKIGVNLNQLTKRANAGFLPPGLIKVLEHLGQQQQAIIQLLMNHDSQSKDR